MAGMGISLKASSTNISDTSANNEAFGKENSRLAG
ncbi:MAG: hypothetical protein ACI9G5_001475 [Paracoccaceae bacterium]|jgi:hypothetical protein